MRRLLCFFCCAALITVVGCGVFEKEPTPEEVGQKFIEAKFKDTQIDVTGLKYSIVEQTNDKAVVKVAGVINLDEKIGLVKKDGEWEIVAASEKQPESGHTSEPKQDKGH